MSQRGLRLLRAARQEAKEDHLGAGLIRHGDSVTIRMKPEKQIAFQEGWNRENIVPLLPLVTKGLSFLSARRKQVSKRKAPICTLPGEEEGEEKVLLRED